MTSQFEISNPTESDELALLTLQIVRLLDPFTILNQQMVIDAVIDRIERPAYHQEKFDAALEYIANGMIAKGGPL